MPRGFLVKRTHKAGPASYRIQSPSAEPLGATPWPLGCPPPLPPTQGSPAGASRTPASCPLPQNPLLPAASPSSSRRGAIVCQLCRQAYGDPPSLARHGCSGLARVEYRCPQCPKAFSCLANLASHRRWHKPRGQGAAKENQSPEPGTGPDSHQADFGCAHCSRRFRRRSDLHRHLQLHRAGPGLSQSQHLHGNRPPIPVCLPKEGALGLAVVSQPCPLGAVVSTSLSRGKGAGLALTTPTLCQLLLTL
ncbi:serine/threonine-protein kinase NIM1 [Platysternon megacephalum]|uniref:Serine/threonine-protein kinase NIM1 n=1 Tax=Platysternon megacephalum TaxID=55544 RepID=A0A4D9ENS5_9SAUR|nr:serine/threonine-protein kinase NIM1 [Platysternon megacephalum]